MSDAPETQDPRRSAAATPAPSGPPSANPRSSDKVVGNYVLRKKLGAGAVGEVWLARDRILGRDVALKFFRADVSHGENDVREFLKEARAAAKLNHPNIATIYQVGRADGRVFIAMEYVPGGSLSDELRDKGALPWRDATLAVRDAAAGLAEAHAANLVHRDIKPSNLMRSSRGLVKVVDFGLARSESFDAGISRTQPGMLLGSPGYMSPEQCRGQRADARSDLYSLICTFYQLLTRQFPFDGAEMTQVLYQHCHEPFPDASKKVGNLPDGLLRILSRGSQKKPEDRYQTADALLADLDALLATPDQSHTFGNPVMCDLDKSVKVDSPVEPGGPRPMPPQRADIGSGRPGSPGDSASVQSGRSYKQVTISLLKGEGLMGKLTWAAMLAVVCGVIALSVQHIIAAGQNPPAQASLNGKKPLPPVRDQAKAEQTIKSLFKSDYADGSVTGKLALAAKLLSQGSADDKPAIRFVSFRDARDLSASAGDFDAASAAIDALDKEFAIDALDMRATALATVAPLSTAASSPGIVDAGTALLDQSLPDENFPIARKILAAMDTAAAKSKLLPLVTKVQDRKTQVAALQHEYNQVQVARATLKRDPADPAANLAVGRYLAFVKNDWDGGLPLLAKGSDATLKDLATREMKKPSDSAVRLKLADSWWQGAEKLDPPGQAAARAHAQFLYAAIWPELAAVDKTKTALTPRYATTAALA
jgi:serine/threonine protein kinase